MTKFDNVKVGDKVWSTIFGWGEIVAINKDDNFPLKVFFGDYREEFDFEGRYWEHSLVTLFWNEIKLPSNEEDKKPFNLVEYLRENLEPKEFIYKDNNIFLY